MAGHVHMNVSICVLLELTNHSIDFSVVTLWVMGSSLRLCLVKQNKSFAFTIQASNVAHVNWGQLFNDFTVCRFGPKDVSLFAIRMSKPVHNRERKDRHCVAWQWLVLWHFQVAIVVIKALMIQSLEIRCWAIPWCYSCAWVELRCNFLHPFVRILEKACLTQEHCSIPSNLPASKHKELNQELCMLRLWVSDPKPTQDWNC